MIECHLVQFRVTDSTSATPTQTSMKLSGHSSNMISITFFHV